MPRSIVVLARAIVVPALLWSISITQAACGGNPIGPSSMSASTAGGVTVRGTLVGSPSSTIRGAASIESNTTALLVRVLENPSLQSSVAPDDTFTISDLPEGSFTLVFLRGAAELGRLPFHDVDSNVELVVKIQVNAGGGVTLLEEQRHGAGHEDAEIEGRIDSLLSVNAAADSRLRVAGRVIVIRAGVTRVRQGNRTLLVTDLTVGQRVHVKGAWLPAEAGGQPLLASEVRLQDDDEDEPSPGSQACAAAGKDVEAEGLVSALQANAFVVDQQGRPDVLALVSATTRIRKGNRSYTFADLRMGWRVHVKGESLGAVGGLCTADADEVKVQ